MAYLHEVRSARKQAFVRHPEHTRFELVAGRGPIAHSSKHIAARDIDFVGERQRHRIAGNRTIDLAARSSDRRHLGQSARWQHDDFVAASDRAAHDRSGKAAKIGVGPIDPLHRHSKRFVFAVIIDIDRFKMAEQRSTEIPRRILTASRDIVAVPRRHRDRSNVFEIKTRGEFFELGRNVLEHRAVEIDQVDLVDRQHNMPNAQEANNHRVAACLTQQALAGIDQQYREIGIRRACCHISCVLFVARRVGDDERSPVGREIPVRHVDGDALLPLGLEAVKQQRVVNLATRCAVTF